MAQMQRPWTITLVEVLAVISGLFGVAAGIFTIADRDNLDLIAKTQLTPDQLLWLGIILIAVGAIKILLASALGRGNEVVRIVFVVVASLNLAGGLYGAFALYGEQAATASVAAVLAGVTLWLLLNQKASDYFDAMSK